MGPIHPAFAIAAPVIGLAVVLRPKGTGPRVPIILQGFGVSTGVRPA